MVILNPSELVSFLQENAKDPVAIAEKFDDMRSQILSEKVSRTCSKILTSSTKNVFLINPSLSEFGYDLVRRSLKRGTIVSIAVDCVARKYSEELSDGSVIETPWYLRADRKDILMKMTSLGYSEDECDTMYTSENINPCWMTNTLMRNERDLTFHTLHRTRCVVTCKLFVHIKNER